MKNDFFSIIFTPDNFRINTNNSKKGKVTTLECEM